MNSTNNQNKGVGVIVFNTTFLAISIKINS